MVYIYNERYTEIKLLKFDQKKDKTRFDEDHEDQYEKIKA